MEPLIPTPSSRASSAQSPKPLAQCRSWLFVPGHDPARLDQALDSGAEAIIVDLEEFTPAADRRQACDDFVAFAERCRQHQRLPMARINPLTQGGKGELAALMRARPAAIFLPQVESSMDIVLLALALAREERRVGLEQGCTALIPTLESAVGVGAAAEILKASPRVSAALLGSGDLSRDLGIAADAAPDERASVLAPWRQRFVDACAKAECLAIDGPWPYREGFEQDLEWAMARGFRARCVVLPEQIAPLHRALTDA